MDRKRRRLQWLGEQRNVNRGRRRVEGYLLSYLAANQEYRWRFISMVIQSFITDSVY